jgi:hypothetical protein
MVNFLCLCEQVLLEEALHNDLIEISNEAAESYKDYEKQKGQKSIDQKFLHNALYSVLDELRQRLRKVLVPFENNLKLKFPLNTPEGLDDFLFKKTKTYPGLKYLFSAFIKPL